MEINLKQMITIEELIYLAKFLKSEHGDNKEYDRALVEIITDAARLPQENNSVIAKLIEVGT